MLNVGLYFGWHTKTQKTHIIPKSEGKRMGCVGVNGVIGVSSVKHAEANLTEKEKGKKRSGGRWDSQ
jgi:hypothetical protein